MKEKITKLRDLCNEILEEVSNTRRTRCLKWKETKPEKWEFKDAIEKRISKMEPGDKVSILGVVVHAEPMCGCYRVSYKVYGYKSEKVHCDTNYADYAASQVWKLIAKEMCVCTCKELELCNCS